MMESEKKKHTHIEEEKTRKTNKQSDDDNAL